MLTLPNFLTLLRIIAVPIYLILIIGNRPGPALILFMLAGITDAVDGVLARLMDAKSDLGAALDPLADKLLLVSSYVTLAWLGVIPPWLMILVLVRDVVILAGYLAIYFVTTPMELAPTLIGKINTCMEMITVVLALTTLARPDMPMGLTNQIAWWITGITVAVSGTHYVYSGLLWYQRQPAQNVADG